MHTSESINEIAAALSLAQGEIEDAEKDSTNPHFKNTYASLSSVMAVIRPVFSKHGLALIQAPGYSEGRVTMGTRILHKSGQWIHNDSSVKLVQDTAQGFGSCITYLRRYDAAAMAGVSAVDDDGTAASHLDDKKKGQSYSVYSLSDKDFIAALDKRLAMQNISGLKNKVLDLLLGKAMVPGALDNAIEKAKALEG